MNTYDQMRLYGFRRLGTKVRLTNSLEMAITTKVNQGKLFLADIKTQNLLGDGQRRYYGMDEKPTRTWINEKNFRKTSFGTNVHFAMPTLIRRTFPRRGC